MRRKSLVPSDALAAAAEAARAAAELRAQKTELEEQMAMMQAQLASLNDIVSPPGATATSSAAATAPPVDDGSSMFAGVKASKVDNAWYVDLSNRMPPRDVLLKYWNSTFVAPVPAPTGSRYALSFMTKLPNVGDASGLLTPVHWHGNYGRQLLEDLIATSGATPQAYVARAQVLLALFNYLSCSPIHDDSVKYGPYHPRGEGRHLAGLESLLHRVDEKDEMAFPIVVVPPRGAPQSDAKRECASIVEIMTYLEAVHPWITAYTAYAKQLADDRHAAAAPHSNAWASAGAASSVTAATSSPAPRPVIPAPLPAPAGVGGPSAPPSTNAA